jgi:hypothetical protein
LLQQNDIFGPVPEALCALDSTNSTRTLQQLETDCSSPPDPPLVSCPEGCCTKCYSANDRDANNDNDADQDEEGEEAGAALTVSLAPSSTQTMAPSVSVPVPADTTSQAPSQAPTITMTSEPTLAPTTRDGEGENNTDGDEQEEEEEEAAVTLAPTIAPVVPVITITSEPTLAPTTKAPTASPTKSPTASPTKAPTASPTKSPTKAPTTSSPTVSPTVKASEFPSVAPSPIPSQSPSLSVQPTANPTRSPTSSPTKGPTTSPTASPTKAPTTSPTRSMMPSSAPSGSPTSSPSAAPSQSPSAAPTPYASYFESEVLITIANIPGLLNNVSVSVFEREMLSFLSETYPQDDTLYSQYDVDITKLEVVSQTLSLPGTDNIFVIRGNRTDAMLGTGSSDTNLLVGMHIGGDVHPYDPADHFIFADYVLNGLEEHYFDLATRLRNSGDVAFALIPTSASASSADRELPTTNTLRVGNLGYGASVAVVVGICAGMLLLLCLGLMCACCYWKRRNNVKQQQDYEEGHKEEEEANGNHIGTKGDENDDEHMLPTTVDTAMQGLLSGDSAASGSSAKHGGDGDETSTNCSSTGSGRDRGNIPPNEAFDATRRPLLMKKNKHGNDPPVEEEEGTPRRAGSDVVSDRDQHEQPEMEEGRSSKSFDENTTNDDLDDDKDDETESDVAEKTKEEKSSPKGSQLLRDLASESSYGDDQSETSRNDDNDYDNDKQQSQRAQRVRGGTASRLAPNEDHHEEEEDDSSDADADSHNKNDEDHSLLEELK